MTPAPPPAAAPLDSALIERVRTREPEAMGQFYDRYLDLVFGLAWRLLGDRTLAEDVTSEVFLKVHRAADRLDPARTLSRLGHSGDFRRGRSSLNVG